MKRKQPKTKSALRMLRKASTEANEKYGIGGREKKRQPKAITLPVLKFLSEKLAFYKDNGDGTWSAVIVGNIVDKKGEVLDARLNWQKPALDEWVSDQVGTHHQVYPTHRAKAAEE